MADCITEMKPCPFCGKQPITRVIPNGERITLKVFCPGPCEVAQSDSVKEFCSFDTITQAMENAMYAWNRRTGNGTT